ncbi:unnamed protein product [Medioppia subpectinata]|uniref:Contactin n=1 Tax=Medioppia subpectinata TaxID=1979941 RepID=A0A7R9KPY1_9ACAR|nr:unnamed protein product [Medioppia subpectinata]CAG2107336.1 unnamed protein product [Medioppia subpectinata]
MIVHSFNCLLIIISIYLTNYVMCQSCPNGWEEFQYSCYKFTRNPVKNVIQAEDTCILYNSHLISVNTLDEHLFVTNWLRNNDPLHRKWHTSGRDTGNNNWKWDSDRSDFTMISDLWLPFNENSVNRFDWTLNTGKHSAYNFSQTASRWGLIRVTENQELPYICEIKKEDLANAVISEREIDYGITVVDKRQVPRGPIFTQEPKNAVFDLSGRSQLNYVSIRCVADGYPTPIYKWYKEEYVNNRLTSRYIDPLSDNRITQTDGTLTIYNPQQTNDRGKYHCTAENRFGIIISQTVQLSFGYIGEFTKKRSPDYGKEYWGKSISCDPPQHHPRVNYYWTRNSFPNFVEEDRRVFVSHDGNLYFSSLEKIDRANYSCNVQSVISSTGRTGPFFPLIVDPASSGQKLLFPNNFPKAFPEAPLAGDDVRLECMAYGYPVPSYNWSRSGVTNRLPENAYTTNHNRVLILPKVQVEDMGDYVCTVNSGRDVIQKKVMLSIQSLPVFTIKLGNKVIERGAVRPLIWTCEAFGIPEVFYQWYKNGEELKDRSLMDNSLSPEDRQRYIVNQNILTIDGLIPDRDEGMYQCRASNQLGSAFSSGQLRIISMAPSFRKHPLDIETYASEGGNITIPCVPEAIPFPTFEWQKEGSRIGGSVGRIRILPNGFLSVNPVQISDEGLYTCVARNDLGFDRSQGYLRVFNRPRIYDGPAVSYERRVNETLEMPCSAFTDAALDVAYIWRHNGLRINFTKTPQFSEGICFVQMQKHCKLQMTY